MKQFTNPTQRIINAHKSDFNCTNYQQKLSSVGGYGAYLKKLGGVFQRWNGKTAKVKTVTEFYEIAEYVFGLMSIYGFDYNNGSLYRKWAGGAPFYTGSNKGRSNWGKIDDLCGKSTKDKTTNCNYGMDALLYKAGLFGQNGQPTNSCGFKSHIKKWKHKFITKQEHLQIGDLVQFFRSRITSDNPDDWEGWGHVAVVGEIINGKIILFDSGGRFITTGNYRVPFNVDKDNKPLGKYSNYSGWIATRDFFLQGAEHDKVKDRFTTDLAIGTLFGEYGSGAIRKNYLGDRYDIVQKLVNHFVTSKGYNDYLVACAQYVLHGYAGSGDYRKDYLDTDYTAVQNKINEILKNPRSVTQYALDVINGEYGNGDTRKQKLGTMYNAVQKKVDFMLGTS